MLHYVLTLGRSRRGKKSSKTFFKVLEKQTMQNQTIFDLYTEDKLIKIFWQS